jgi:hypothetical protein
MHVNDGIDHHAIGANEAFVQRITVAFIAEQPIKFGNVGGKVVGMRQLFPVFSSSCFRV